MRVKDQTVLSLIVLTSVPWGQMNSLGAVLCEHGPRFIRLYENQ